MPAASCSPECGTALPPCNNHSSTACLDAGPLSRPARQREAGLSATSLHTARLLLATKSLSGIASTPAFATRCVPGRESTRRHVRHKKNPLLDSTTKDQEKAERPACSTLGNLRSQTRCGKSFNQRTKRRTEEAKKDLPTPRIELGFAEPQSAVLTTILCEPIECAKFVYLNCQLLSVVRAGIN